MEPTASINSTTMVNLRARVETTGRTGPQYPTCVWSGSGAAAVVGTSLRLLRQTRQSTLLGSPAAPQLGQDFDAPVLGATGGCLAVRIALQRAPARARHMNNSSHAPTCWDLLEIEAAWLPPVSHQLDERLGNRRAEAAVGAGVRRVGSSRTLSSLCGRASMTGQVPIGSQRCAAPVSEPARGSQRECLRTPMAAAASSRSRRQPAPRFRSC